MVTVTPSPLGGQMQSTSIRSAETSPSHSHSHSHSQMSRNSSRKSNNSVNCKLDGMIQNKDINIDLGWYTYNENCSVTVGGREFLLK